MLNFPKLPNLLDFKIIINQSRLSLHMSLASFYLEPFPIEKALLQIV